MRGHVVVSLLVMPIRRVAVGSPARGEDFEVATHRRVGVFGQHHRTTRMLDKDMDDAGNHPGSPDDARHLVGDLEGAATAATKVKGLLMSHQSLLSCSPRRRSRGS
jgi:hypothetical protein